MKQTTDILEKMISHCQGLEKSILELGSFDSLRILTSVKLKSR